MPSRAVVIVVGTDQPGIIARVSGVLAEHRINIQDISQAFAAEIFTMILIVDLAGSDVPIKAVETELKGAVEDMGLFVSVQHEDVFRAMHRI